MKNIDEYARKFIFYGKCNEKEKEKRIIEPFKMELMLIKTKNCGENNYTY